MSDTLSPTTAREAFDHLLPRIAATAPSRTRTIPMAEAARRGVELAQLLTAPELAEPLARLGAAGLAPNLATDLRLASLALFHRATLREHQPVAAPSATRVPVALWDDVLRVRRELLDTLAFGLRHDADAQDTLARVRSGTGYLDHAQDLATLAELGHTHATALLAAMPGHFSLATVQHASTLATAMLEALGVTADAQSDDTDQRTFGLFFGLFNEARSALQFLWRADAARFDRVPTLGFRRAGASGGAAAEPAVSDPVANP